MRFIVLAGLALAAPAFAAPTDNPWHAKARAMLEHAIDVPTEKGQGKVPELANWFADQFRAAGWADSDIHVIPYEGDLGDKTAALIVRWPAAGAPKASRSC